MVGVQVLVGVPVRVGVRVRLGVLVGVLVGVGVRVFQMDVGVRVGVGVAAISCAAMKNIANKNFSTIHQPPSPQRLLLHCAKPLTAIGQRPLD